MSHAVEFHGDGMPAVVSTPNIIQFLERTARPAQTRRHSHGKFQPPREGQDGLKSARCWTRMTLPEPGCSTFPRRAGQGAGTAGKVFTSEAD
jgi:hypothetical protein